jgi:hypothetical protein
MERKYAAAIIAAGFVGFYFGSPDGVQYENPEKEYEYQYTRVEVPRIPKVCRDMLVDSTKVQWKRSEDENLYNQRLNECLITAEEDIRVAEGEASLLNALNNYNAGDEDELTEEEVEEAFEECEIDYGDSEYCEDNLEEYLSRD